MSLLAAQKEHADFLGLLRDTALAYARQHFSIISVRNDAKGHKKPACSLAPYLKCAATEKAIRALFSPDRSPTGLAVVLGAVSHGLYARDFDDQAAYIRWAAQFPDLARQLPTTRTARGYHVFAISSQPVRTKDLGDGELRGEGSYVVLPPSLHPNGTSYSWHRPTPLHLCLALSPQQAGLDHPWPPTEAECEQREDRDLQRPTEETQTRWGAARRGGETTGAPKAENRAPDDTAHDEKSPQRPSPPGSDPFVPPLEELLRRVRPTGPRKNHPLLFYLARGVRALELAEGDQWSPKEKFERAFLPWYRDAKMRGFLREGQTRDEYWAEFLDGYPRVERPLGQDALASAWKRSEKMAIPAAAEQFEGRELRRLVTLCQELQRDKGDDPIYLSVRIVQSLFGLGSPRNGKSLLDVLVKTGILLVVKKGDQKTRKATRFRYVPALE